MEEKKKTSEKRVKYIADYHKNHYKTQSVHFKLDFYQKIEKYCKKYKVSVSALVNKSIKYIIDNKIDINGLE